MKRHVTQRMTALLLALCILVLPACSQGAAQTEDTETPAESVPSATETTPAEEAETEPEDARAHCPDSLPATMDFDGVSYRILCQDTYLSATSQVKNEMISEQITGEIVNDAIYNRAQSVMERMNVSIIGTMDNDVIKTLQSTIAGADPICEIAAAYAYFVTPLALQGSFLNWLKMEHLDLEQPWWPKSLADDLIIDDKLYFISGDISLKLIQYLYCVFFNKTLAESWDIPNLYDIVLEGNWTLDRFMEYASSVSQDLNGDGEYTEKDLYGTVQTPYTDVRFAAYDLPVSTQAEDGTLELCVMNEKFVDVHDKMYAFYRNGTYAYRLPDNNPERPNKMFSSGNLLFNPFLMYSSESFREMEDDYGIIPYPKYNEEQEEYGTYSHDNYSLMCMPVYVDPSLHEMVGAVTEALAAESYRTVTPAYLEVSMKDKFLRDEYSADMLDIITSSVKFDPAIVYSACLGNIMHLIHCEFDGIENITSTYKRRKRTYEYSIKDFNKKFLALD